MAERFKVLTLNNIAEIGLSRLPAERYEAGSKIADPDAILVRSQDMHAMPISPRVRAIARAGAGTNNIPVKAMSANGRAGVQRAGRQRQCGQGAGDRRHAHRGAQSAAGDTLCRQSCGRRRNAQQGGRRGQEKFCRHRVAPAYARRHRARQDRQPRGGCGDQARHERARLRSAHHGRCGVEPAVAGQEGELRRGSAEGGGFRHAARAATSKRPKTSSTPSASRSCTMAPSCSISRAMA